MKFRLLFAAVIAVSVTSLFAFASPREVALPAGTLLQCTINEPNFSSATAEVGDPVVCHLRGVTEFGQQAFPRGSYLVGHLESAKEPGHFVGKGSMKLQFDRIGLPSGDLPIEAKMIGKGHATRDVVEWMIPPLWPWKVVALPARGPRPRLKGENVVELRLMDDLLVPQMANIPEPGFHFFARPSAYSEGAHAGDIPQVDSRDADRQASQQAQQPSYANYVSRDLPHDPVGAQSRLDPESVAASSPSGGSPVFLLKSGTLLSIGNYSYRDGRLTYTLAGGGGGVISADDVDWSATTRVNSARGIRVTLRSGHTGPLAPGL
jgi:hypothetical protein